MILQKQILEIIGWTCGFVGYSFISFGDLVGEEF